MPELVIAIDEESFTRLGSIAASEGLSVEEEAANCILRRLREIQEEAMSLALPDELQ